MDRRRDQASAPLDGVVQRLWAAGLSLQEAAALLAPASRAAAPIQCALDDLDVAVRAVHLSAFAPGTGAAALAEAPVAPVGLDPPRAETGS